MTAPFVTQLRTRGEPIRMSGATDALTVRIEMPEVWETVNVVVAPTESIAALKTRVLQSLFPSAESHEDFVLKLRGWEVLDETASVAGTGAVSGSIFLLTHRNRRPVH